MKKKILSITILILILLCNLSVYATDEQKELPSKYDLRNEFPITMQKQISGDFNKGPSCYSYTKVKMAETYLQKTKGLNYNFSEAYLGYHGEKEGVFVLESDFPNKMYAQIPNIDQKVEAASKKAVVKNFEYLYDFKQTHENIKKYMLDYGAVLIATSSDTQMENYNNTSIYRKEEVKPHKPHTLLIIGWDDNYSKDNFTYEKPENDGAWLVLNSWGTQWANNGAAWVSYEDYETQPGSVEFIGSMTLADGEVIKTELGGSQLDMLQKEMGDVKFSLDLKNIEKDTEQNTEQKSNKQSIFGIVTELFKNIFNF